MPSTERGGERRMAARNAVWIRELSLSCPATTAVLNRRRIQKRTTATDDDDDDEDRIIFFRRRREEPKRGAITALRKAVPLEMPFKKQRSQGFREKALNVWRLGILSLLNGGSEEWLRCHVATERRRRRRSYFIFSTSSTQKSKSEGLLN